MPLQNRVTPFGALIATPERGTLLGNRGLLHDPQKRIKREWLLKRWIYCVLEFKGRHRTVMAPGRYTEFFPRRSHQPGGGTPAMRRMQAGAV